MPFDMVVFNYIFCPLVTWQHVVGAGLWIAAFIYVALLSLRIPLLCLGWLLQQVGAILVALGHVSQSMSSATHDAFGQLSTDISRSTLTKWEKLLRILCLGAAVNIMAKGWKMLTSVEVDVDHHHYFDDRYHFYVGDL
jgi:hypothetical protein